MLNAFLVYFISNKTFRTSFFSPRWSLIQLFGSVSVLMFVWMWQKSASHTTPSYISIWGGFLRQHHYECILISHRLCHLLNLNVKCNVALLHFFSFFLLFVKHIELHPCLKSALTTAAFTFTSSTDEPRWGDWFEFISRLKVYNNHHSVDTQLRTAIIMCNLFYSTFLLFWLSSIYVLHLQHYNYRYDHVYLVWLTSVNICSQ